MLGIKRLKALADKLRAAIITVAAALLLMLMLQGVTIWLLLERTAPP